MTRRTSRGSEVVTPSLVLRAYMCGIFPMADSADDPNLYWIEPRQRGVLPLDNFHVPKRLARTIRSTAYDVRIDEDFDGVIEGCAKSRSGRRATWINQPIRDLYGALFRAGQAHTVEIWEGDALVGGLYGVRIGAAFFGESMFSDVRDASKIALVHLAGRLRRGGFKLLDTQFLTEHLAQFGGIEVPRDEYLALLGEAIAEPAEFRPFPEDRVPGGAVSGEMILEALRAA